MAIFTPILQIISDILSVSVDQLRIAFILIIIFPFSYLFKSIKNPQARKYFSLVFGLFAQYEVYQNDMAFCLFQTILVYVLVSIFGRKSGKLVFIESILFLSIFHLYRQITDPRSWKLDVTTILMMFTCKYTSFAFSYSDGDKKIEDLSQDHNRLKIEQLPNFTDYLSYIYFFPSVISGPHFEYIDYKNFIDLKDKYSSIPNSFLKSMKYLVYSAGMMLSAVFIYSNYPILDFTNDCINKNLPENDPICFSHQKTIEFQNSSMLYKFIYMNISVTSKRTLYYTAWCLAQISIIGSGFAYNGKDQNQIDKWDGVLTADPSLELQYGLKEKLEKWNASVAQWLKRHVYFRVFQESQIKASVRKQNLAQYWTNFISALWHGFYPSYYLAFVQVAIFANLNKFCYKLSINKPQFYSNSVIFYLLLWIINNSLLNYIGYVFQLLDLKSSYEFSKEFYFIFNILPVVSLGFFYATRFGQKKIEKRQ